MCVFLDLDYLTSSNFMDMLDTGVLICHLARRIQGIAKDVVTSRSRALFGDGVDAAAKYDDASTAALLNVPPDNVKQAQQYLQALLRSTNNQANLLAAAKVYSFLFFSFFVPSVLTVNRYSIVKRKDALNMTSPSSCVDWYRF